MNHSELISKYRKQLTRIFGTYPDSINIMIEGMDDNKLIRDVEILKGYPSNIPAFLESPGPIEPKEIIEDAKRRVDFDGHNVA